MTRSSRYIGHDEPRHGESHVNEYLKCALVPLSLSLRSLLEGISHLADAIDLAKQCCRNKTDHLDQDQASAIYLVAFISFLNLIAFFAAASKYYFRYSFS